MKDFSNHFFWIKNRWFRAEAQKAYISAMGYCNLSREKRIAQDIESRRNLVRYAYEHCPFYKQMYDQEGFHPSHLQTESDWEKVPIVEKWMIRKHANAMISNESSKARLEISSTGGSTGEPLKVYKSKHVHYEVLGWRALNWWGVSPADNEAILHRRVPTTFRQRLLNALLWWPTRRAFLAATAVTEKGITRFLDDLHRKKIEWMVGYCASLEYVADYVLSHNIRVDGLKLVWSTSSPLTDLVRRKLEKAFHCPVMDQYGCCEMGHIAVQRPGENCLTINADYVHVDIVNDQQEIVNTSHQYGDVLITELKTREFPLIKYRLGDKCRFVQTMEEADDGMPRIDFVRGRNTDALWLPDGTYIDGAYLTTLCDNYTDSIQYYQIHQKDDFSVDFLFVPHPTALNYERDIDTVLAKMRELTLGQILIKHCIVDNIPDFAGKRKFIISDISLNKNKTQ